MTSPISWLSPAMMQALGWALIHFLWQGAAIAALAALLMRFCRGPRARYGLGVGALTLMLAMPLVTLLAMGASSSLPLPVSPFAAPIFLPARPDILPWVVVGWLGGVVLLSLRFAGGFLLLQTRQRRQSHAVRPHVLALCQAVQQRLGIRRSVRYLECAWLQVPAVIGCIRPVVLLPIAALMGLTEAQLRAVIAHELAHVRRWDFLVNLFQILAETLLFYHPAVWWLNRRICSEREMCCDEAAVAEIGNRIAYADALVEYARAVALMEEWQSAPGPALAANHGILSERIFHILGLPCSKPRLAGLAGSLFLLSASLAVAGILIFPGVPVPASHEDVPSVASAAMIAGKQIAQAQALPVRETQTGQTARAKAYVIPRRNRLALIRTIKPHSSISLPLLMAAPDLPPAAASDTPAVIGDSQSEGLLAPAHVTSVVAAELEAQAAPDRQYPAASLKMNASRGWEEWTHGEAMDYCKDFASQTVAQGANRPILVDDGVKQRLSFFYWQCLRSNNNGLVRAYGDGDGMGTSPAYAAVGAASSDHPVNVSGSWTISVPASARPNTGGMLAIRAEAQSCSFSQSENTIRGTCTGREGSGAAMGVIDGRQVRWVWKFPSVGREAEYDFIAMIGPDGAMTGQSIMVKDMYSRAVEMFMASPGAAPTQVASQK